MLNKPSVKVFDPLDDIRGKSIEELARLNANGEHDRIDALLTTENFPVPIERRMSKEIPVLLSYDRADGHVASLDMILADMEKRGFDRPNEHEGLAFGAKYPEEVYGGHQSVYVLGKGYWLPAIRANLHVVLGSWSHVRLIGLAQCDYSNLLAHSDCFLAFASKEMICSIKENNARLNEMDPIELKKAVFEACGYRFEHDSENPSSYRIVTPTGEKAMLWPNIEIAIETFTNGNMDNRANEAITMLRKYARRYNVSESDIEEAIQEIGQKSVVQLLLSPEEEIATTICKAILLLSEGK